MFETPSQARVIKRDLLRVENLRICFELHGSQLEVVKGVSFRVRPGSIVALVGESGSGKSVISQSILGILPDSASISGGKILFRDPQNSEEVIDIAALKTNSHKMRSLRGGRISMIFQEPMTSMSPLHTIGNQVEEALVLHSDVAVKDRRKLTEEMLTLVGFPDPKRAYDCYSFELSGGLRQRAMIAMALICHPALLIADEPTTALDVTVQAQILKLLKELQQHLNMAVLLITHDLGVVANMADEIVVIYHGEITESGSAQHIFNQPGHPYLQALLKAVPHFDMQPGERLVSLRDISSEDTASSGTTDTTKGVMALQPDQLQARLHSKGETLLSVRDLRKVFTTSKGGFFGNKSKTELVAIDNVSFDIKRGECLGLVGESGCGKTTVSKVIMRAVTPDKGVVQFNHEDTTTNILDLKEEHLKAFRPRIQMIFQDPFGSLSPRMTVADILREPLIIHNCGSVKEQMEAIQELMHVVGLDPRFLNRYPHSFSGGQRQRIGIARALALNPELIICDEPVSALDVSVQAQILNLLKDLQSSMGLTFLFISHNLAVVDYVADRIAVMCAGRLVEIAAREDLFRNPVHPYTRQLLTAVPYADLNRPLDFACLELGGAKNAANWPNRFKPGEDGSSLQHIDMGDGHFVLVNEQVSPAELHS
jgi:peptide/nickel transport system ATP-binding protein